MGRITGERSSELAAPVHTVHAVLLDVEAYPQWQSDVKDADVHETDAEGRPLVAEIRQDAKVKTIRIRVRYEHEPPHRMSWVLEEGDVKAMDGSWHLEEVAGGITRATYRLEVDPGRALGFLLRGPAVGKVTDHVLDGTLKALKARVEE